MSEPAGHLADYDTEPRYTAHVVFNERITPATADEEVREIVFDVRRDDFPYRIGQSIGVLAPGSADFGHEHHFRLYSVADLPERGPDGRPRLKIAVRRCFYIDEYSGEQHPGIASNFLCDLQPGDTFETTGPFGLVFEVPEDRDAQLVLIGSGTGIAPFRAFVKHIYRDVPDWRGRIWLFYGARTGLEMLYMNEERDDFANYYDRETFKAFRVLSPRPSWGAPLAWGEALGARGDELWHMLEDPKTHVYVAGLEEMIAHLDEVFAKLAGSEEKWQRRKAELRAGKRWLELVY